MENREILKIKNDIKIELIDYFDTVKFQIDIKVQEVLESLREQAKHKEVLELNEKFIQTIDGLLDTNIKSINKYFDNLASKNKSTNTTADFNKEDIKFKTVNGYCYFLKIDDVKRRFKREIKVATNVNIIGLLVVTDWYLDENQLNYLRFHFEENKNKKFDNMKFSYDQNVLMLRIHFNEIIKNYYTSINDLFSKGEYLIRKETLKLNQGQISLLEIDFGLEIEHLNSLKYKTLNYLTDKCVTLTLTNTPKLEKNSLLMNENKLQNMTVIGYKHIKQHVEFNLFDHLENFKYLENLNLSNIGLKQIPSNVFMALPNLKRFKLSNNIFEVLRIEMFNGLVNLEHLDLIDCRINSIEKGFFKVMPSLTYLNLSGNELELLNENIFDNLDKLVEMNLNKCQIKSILPNSFASLRKLNKLILSSNVFKESSSLNSNSFTGLDNLIYLDLSCCRISELQIDLFNIETKLKSLKHLSLKSNELRHLKANQFDGLKHALLIDIEDCFIASIDPDSFVGLANLKRLYMYGNPISKNDTTKSYHENNKSLACVNNMYLTKLKSSTRVITQKKTFEDFLKDEQEI